MTIYLLEVEHRTETNTQRDGAAKITFRALEIFFTKQQKLLTVSHQRTTS
jgi:hypothetical protein